MFSQTWSYPVLPEVQSVCGDVFFYHKLPMHVHRVDTFSWSSRESCSSAGLWWRDLHIGTKVRKNICNWGYLAISWVRYLWRNNYERQIILASVPSLPLPNADFCITEPEVTLLPISNSVLASSKCTLWIYLLLVGRIGVVSVKRPSLTV